MASVRKPWAYICASSEAFLLNRKQQRAVGLVLSNSKTRFSATIAEDKANVGLIVTYSQGQALSYPPVKYKLVKVQRSSSSRLHTVHDWPNLARKTEYCAARMAQECGVSVRQLERFVRDRMGKSPQKWLNALRQSEAVAMIIQGKSIKEVAYHLGYKQPSHFSREFKRAHGISPSSARKTFSI